MKNLVKLMACCLIAVIATATSVSAFDQTVPEQPLSTYKVLPQNDVHQSVVNAFPLQVKYRPLDYNKVFFTEIYSAVDYLNEEVLNGKITYAGDKYFVIVVPGSKSNNYFYSEVIGDIYYSGYLTITKIAANGTVYEGYLKGYYKNDIMSVIYDKLR